MYNYTKQALSPSPKENLIYAVYDISYISVQLLLIPLVPPETLTDDEWG